MSFALTALAPLVERLVVVDIAPVAYQPGPSSAVVASVLRGISKYATPKGRALVSVLLGIFRV